MPQMMVGLAIYITTSAQACLLEVRSKKRKIKGSVIGEFFYIPK